MKTRLKLLLILSTFVLFYAAYYWGIPAVVNIKSRTPELQKLVKNELGFDVNIKDPELKMGLIPSVWVGASYFEIQGSKESPLVVENPKLKLKLLPLIFGKIHLGYFGCNKIKGDFSVDKHNRFYVGDYLLLKNSNPRISFEDSKVDVESYEILFKDELHKKKIIAKGNYLYLEKFNTKKYIKGSINANLDINNKKSVINMDIDLKLPIKNGFDTNEIVFDGTITNLDLSELSPYIKKVTNGQIRQTAGVINIQADTEEMSILKNRVKLQMALDNFAIVPKDNASSVSFKNKLNVYSTVDFSKKHLLIQQFKVLSGSISLEITGGVSKLSSNNPKLNLTATINKSKTEDFVSLLPAVNIKYIDINIPAIKKYGFYSNAEGKISIKGNSDKPKIIGKVNISDCYVQSPLNIPRATVKLHFQGDKLDLDVKVPTGKSDAVFVKGNIELYNKKNVVLDISSTQNVDLEIAESILNPVHEMFWFDLGPLPDMKLKGTGNIKLKTAGNKQDPRLFGVFKFKNTEGSFRGLNLLLTRSEGELVFNNRDTHFYTKKAYVEGKPIKIEGKCNLSGDLDYNITANGQYFSKVLPVIATSPILAEINKNFPKINASSGLINISINLKGNAKSIEEFKLGKNIFFSGNIKLLGNSIILSSLNIPIKNLYGNINFKNNDADFDMYSAVDKSKVHVSGKVRNNVLTSKIKLDNLAFNYYDIPVKVYSGTLEINKDKLTLYKINALLDSMPVLLDGFVTDIFVNPKFNIYVNSKPSQRFIDKYINKNALYPLRIKGDVIYSARINGTRDSFNTKAEANLQEDSSIYYLGATLGDVNEPIRIFIDANVSKNKSLHSIVVNNFQYDKLISSQNDKEFVSQQLNAVGRINVDKNNIILNNFRIKTQNPTDARIFNILFKKTMIKQGLFNSNVIINGPINSPKLLGSLNFTGVNIPLVDTTVKDISMDFKNYDIDVDAKGEVFSNQITLKANMQNRLTPPYVFNDVDIYLGNLDVNEIAKSLNKLELESNINKSSEQKYSLNISDLIIKNARVAAQSVFVRNVLANNLTANFILDEKMLFSMDNLKFDAAQGSIKGNFKYNLLTGKTDLDLDIDKVNANSIAESLFDLPNQVYGDLTGQAQLSCNGSSHKTCMDTLSGKGGFRVADGRMPKLGSLEYLLRAANIVKSGVTGLTLNGLVDLLSPLKTGQFETINGRFAIKSGVANDIQIFSKGKNLSLFLTGTYNFSTLIADMQVFGRVSKKISTILGPVGNASLNTLFNVIPGLNLDSTNKAEFVKNLSKIPGFELNDKTYRIFSADIYGDINGDNYVQTFKWVE